MDKSIFMRLLDFCWEFLVFSGVKDLKVVALKSKNSFILFVLILF